MNKIKTEELFKIEGSSIAYYDLLSYKHPWEAIPKIKDIILEKISALDMKSYEKTDTGAYISRFAKIDSSAKIIGPAIICHGAEIRHCAYIRGNVIVGENAVVGNSTEIKNSILFNNVQVPHYNYVGDSILGYKSHMGAGSVTSNVKSDKTLVVVHTMDEQIQTGYKKFGAMLGDYVEVGCNSVLNPGTVVGCGSTIYPLSSVRGFVPENCIHKTRDNIVQKIKI